MMKSNVMHRWIVLLAAVCVALTMSEANAPAQLRGHDYIGTYRREVPRKHGKMTIFMNIQPKGQAVVRTVRPDGKETTFNGSWHVRHGDLILTTDRGTHTYRLHGPNLERTDDKHDFFKKQ